VAWLANCLGPRGERLHAGWLVLSGGLTAPVPLEPGQAVTAELDGLGSVEVYRASLGSADECPPSDRKIGSDLREHEKAQ
jgi:hypothetical protein